MKKGAKFSAFLDRPILNNLGRIIYNSTPNILKAGLYNPDTYYIIWVRIFKIGGKSRKRGPKLALFSIYYIMKSIEYYVPYYNIISPYRVVVPYGTTNLNSDFDAGRFDLVN